MVLQCQGPRNSCQRLNGKCSWLKEEEVERSRWLTWLRQRLGREQEWVSLCKFLIITSWRYTIVLNGVSLDRHAFEFTRTYSQALPWIKCNKCFKVFSYHVRLFAIYSIFCSGDASPNWHPLSLSMTPGFAKTILLWRITVGDVRHQKVISEV